MAKKLKKGIFITFEGPEGSGKSTHSRRLAKEFKKDGHDVIHTLEPGGTGMGKFIREVLLRKDAVKLCRKAELLLFEADRAQHVEEVIVPALKRGKIVLCDRFNTATYAYQGYGLGMDLDIIKKMDVFAIGGVQPDLTILIDVDVKTGLKRARGKGGHDRMEKRDIRFHEKVRIGYLEMSKRSPKKIKVIKVKGGLDETYKSVKALAYDFIEGHKRAR